MDSRITRRTLVGLAALTPFAAAVARAQGRPTLPLILTSWEFGPGANAVAWPVLAGGGSGLDAVEAAINQVELRADVADVGFGGNPNAVGETTLDAMVMWGPTHDVGAVGCLKRIRRAVSVARKVMERTQHTLIVGDDATAFAARMGFEETSLTNLASQRQYEEWVALGQLPNAWDPEPIGAERAVQGHDTVGSIAIDADGNLCVGCSTNGRLFKLPGRVGDSPIAGAGAYCDNDVGAAIATGNGDVMMRFLPTYQTVELMRSGMAPQDAARAALGRILAKGYRFDGGIIAVARDGRHGGAKAGWADVRFSYAVQNREGAAEFVVG
jgi:N4-(beta-N-acetylglucosaminyl)-L-asparaginase